MNSLNVSTAVTQNVRAPTLLLSLIVPFYNEEEAISAFFTSVIPILNQVAALDYEIVCINDGSTDATLDRLKEAAANNSRILIVDLSRNFGKEAALTAGLDHAKGAAIIPFDADLQDPPETIPLLIQKWQEGFDVVIAKRVERRSDTYLKRSSASLFYRVHNAISQIQIPENVGDFRLMSRPVVEALKQLPENHRFMKGLFAWVGFKTCTVEYSRQPRSAGKTKFSGWKLWNFAIEGITSFSTLPLRVWTYIGSVVALAAFFYAAFLIVRTLLHGVDVPGYASITTIVLFLGGIQLIGIGAVGEYVGRIYSETKRRPIYIVRTLYQSLSQSN